MGIPEEMKKVGEDISSSYDARVERIGQLKKETEEVLKSFQDSHKKMSLELRENLSKYKGDIESEVKKMLKGFHTSLERMSSDLKKDLAKDEESRKAKVRKMMGDFEISHRQMSEELNEDLVKYNQGIKSEVSRMLNEDLVKYNQGIKSEVSRMLSDFHSAQDKVRTDLKELSASWQGLVSTMQEKRSSVKPVPEVPEKKIGKEEVPEKVEIKEEKTEKEQVLMLINRYPEGIKLAEIGAEMGKDWRWYITITKELIEENKIRKEENLYYPIS
jgi:hypothetical protein